jgi:hypothetical protein
LCRQFSLEGGGVDEVDEGPLAVDLNHRKPLPVCGLEPLITGDVDLVERLTARCQDVSSLVAQRAARRVIENDPCYG